MPRTFNLQIFALLLTLYLILNYISLSFLINEEIYYNSFSSILPLEEISRIVSFQNKYGWISYPIQLITIIVKTCFTAICLYIGFLFSEHKTKFKDIYKVVLIAEFVFVLYAMIKLGLLLLKDFSTLEQIEAFWPLSLFSLFKDQTVPAWLLYPLYTANIAEIAYWIVLAFGLSSLKKTKFLQSLRTVLSSYGGGLLLWVVFLVFMQLYFLEFA